MVKWHVSPQDGVARQCSAKVKECKFEHADSEAGAYTLNESLMAKEGHSAFETVKKLENPNDPSIRNQFIGRDLKELIEVQKVYINDYTSVQNEITSLKAQRQEGQMLPKETVDKIKDNELASKKMLNLINKVGYAIDLADGTRSAQPEPMNFVDQKFETVKNYLEDQGDKFHPMSDELLKAINNSKNQEETLQAINRYVDAPAVNKYHEYHHERLRNYLNDDSYYE